MKQMIRFIGHLFFEDKRILVGVALAMVVAELIHLSVRPWINNVIYLAIILATLTLSVLRSY